MKNVKYILLGIAGVVGLYFLSIAYQKITSKNIMLDKNLDEKVVSGELQKIVLAGGCFWCTEASFNPDFGVVEAVSGFVGTGLKDTTYEQVGSGEVKAREAVQVYFNPASTTLRKILVNYWTYFDPTDAGGSFADRGYSYSSGIYYFNDEQKSLAEESKKIIDDSKKFEKPVATEILNGADFVFVPAEEYHQDYAKKNPVRYEYYKNGSGRADFQKDIWADKSMFDTFLKENNNKKK